MNRHQPHADWVAQARTEALRAGHAAVLALEAWREAEHAATVAADIAAAPNHSAVGELYAAHVRCCWDLGLEDVARGRLRDLDRQKSDAAMAAAPMTRTPRLDEPPF